MPKAKNISNKPLCLVNGIVQPGETIDATPAEISVHFNELAVVKVEVKPVEAKPAPKK